MKNTLTIFALLALFGCTEEIIDPPPTVQGSQAVLISNEGNFGNGNGTLSIYNRLEQTVEQKVYERVNSEPLGNVFQSIAHIGDEYYFVINNAQRIVVCNEDFEKMAEIDGFSSPRQILMVGDQKAYVSDLFANKVWIVDLLNRQITGSLPIKGWSEQLLFHKQLCYINVVDKQRIYVVDPSTDNLVDSIELNMQGQGVAIDLNDGLWVLGSGWGAVSSQLYHYELSTLQLLDSVEMSGEAGQLVYDPESNALFYLNNGIRKMTASSGTQPSLLVENNFDAPYKLAFDLRYGELYLSDAHDYQQQSTVYRYDREGVELDRFKAGIISGDFYFPR